MYVYSKKYVKEILLRYHTKHGDLRKVILPLKVKDFPEVDGKKLLYKKDQKEFQHIFGVIQWLIVAGNFDLTHAVISINRFSDATR